jgi:Helicase associated domain
VKPTSRASRSEPAGSTLGALPLDLLHPADHVDLRADHRVEQGLRIAVGSEWQTALEAVDEDWNPAWPADWQRHYAALRELVRDENGPAEVLPGFTVHGMDVGKWLARQRKPGVWAALAEGQRERLERLGIVPLAPEPEELAKPSTTPVSAFEKGIVALAQ